MDQKRIDQIKESLAEFYAYYCDGAGHPLNICADQDMRQLIVEIERLRAIVAKLPKTVDGVPITPGMELHFTGCGSVRVNAVRYSGAVELTTAEAGSTWTKFDTSGCYSTREAAEAAGGKQ